MKATFEADFTTFRAEVDASLVKMRGFESESENVSAALSKMVDQFSGRAVIAEATLMAEAIQRLGGASHLTAAEIVKVGQTAIDAAEQFEKWGQAIPKPIQGLIDVAAASVDAAAKAKRLRDEVDTWGPVTVKAGTSVSGLQSQLSQFNNILAAGGVHVSNELGALSELANASGKTASELGKLTSIGLGVGALMEGWNLGRHIAEWTGTDKIIGDATATLLGWGDAAGQTAGAQADVLAKASANAGRSITDLSEAMAINAEHAKTDADHWAQLAAEQKASADAFDRLRTFIEAGDKAFDQHADQRIANEQRMAAENKRGMEEYERGLLREFELETKVWGDAIKLTDALNARLQTKLDLQTKYQMALAVDVQKARDVNTDRNLGPGISDPALDAAARRDAALRDAASRSAMAPGIDVGPIIQKIWQDFDEQILKRGAAAVAATPPVQVNVSGIMDPRTIDEITDAIMRRTGRLWPGR